MQLLRVRWGRGLLGTKLLKLLVRGVLLSTIVTSLIVVYVMTTDQQNDITADPPESVVESVEVLMANETRLSHLSSVCLQHHNNKRLMTTYNSITYNMIVNDQLKLIYCVVGKTASSTWRKLILVASGVIKGDSLDSLRYTSVRNKGLRYLRSLRHHKWKQISVLLGGYFKFLFVRHPFDRIVSTYRDKFRMQPEYFKKYGLKIIEKYRGINSSLTNGSDVTFPEFVRFLVDTGAREADLHWSPQHQLCKPCEVKYDFIGHYETLQQDAATVLQRLGVPGNITFPKWSNNKTASDTTRALLATVPVQYIADLRKVYAKDFELFGYQ